MPININDIGIIVLAAGSSKRFDGDKRKALLPNGQSLLSTSLSKIPDSINKRILVLRPGDEDLALLYQDQWQIVIAEKAESGMGASLASAIPTAKNWSGTLISLGDMPYIKPETFLKVQKNLCNHSIVVPLFEGQRGHPVGIRQNYFADISTLKEDQGARKILTQNSNVCYELVCKDEGILKDIDTPEAI